MNARKPLTMAMAAGSALVMGLPPQQVQAASLTAQSAEISTTYASTAYQIEPTITWEFDRGTHKEPGTAMRYYSNTRTSGPTFVSCTGGGSGGVNCATSNAPTAAAIAAAEPAPNEIKLQNHAQAERCTFFLGGTLTSEPYDQTATVSGANGKGSWNYTWGYTIAPDPANDIDAGTDGVQVAAHTAWNAIEGGTNTVNVSYSGFVSSESFLNNGATNKYSFTLLEGGVTRVRGVSAQLESSSDGLTNWAAVPGFSADLNNTDTNGDTVNDALAVSPTTADYSYFGNGGVFGKSAVYNALHANGYKPANGVFNILNGVADGTPSDNFAGNNNDLAAGNVHQANYSGTWSNVPGDLDGNTIYYRTVISGTIKGNSAIGSQAFSVASNPIIIGGCTVTP